MSPFYSKLPDKSLMQIKNSSDRKKNLNFPNRLSRIQHKIQKMSAKIHNLNYRLQTIKLLRFFFRIQNLCIIRVFRSLVFDIYHRNRGVVSYLQFLNHTE